MVAQRAASCARPPNPHAGKKGLPVVISYSDGEGAGAQVGVAVWRQGQRIGRAGIVRVPDEVRKKWDPARSHGRPNDIFEIEAVGPLVVLHNFADAVRGAPRLHFGDNAAALSSLVSGSRSVHSRDVIAGQAWSHVEAVGCMPWFDRADSAYNPVGGLSRGRLVGPWDLEPLSFPLLPSHLAPRV